MGIIAANRRNFFEQSLKICWNYGCLWWNAHNSFMLCSWLEKILVPFSWEWRTPFDLPGKAVMRQQASSLGPGKFQAQCKMFLKVLRWVLPILHVPIIEGGKGLFRDPWTSFFFCETWNQKFNSREFVIKGISVTRELAHYFPWSVKSKI